MAVVISSAQLTNLRSRYVYSQAWHPEPHQPGARSPKTPR